MGLNEGCSGGTWKFTWDDWSSTGQKRARKLNGSWQQVSMSTAVWERFIYCSNPRFHTPYFHWKARHQSLVELGLGLGGIWSTWKTRGHPLIIDRCLPQHRPAGGWSRFCPAFCKSAFCAKWCRAELRSSLYANRLRLCRHWHIISAAAATISLFSSPEAVDICSGGGFSEVHRPRVSKKKKVHRPSMDITHQCLSYGT
jgi:hypothetical protein